MFNWLADIFHWFFSRLEKNLKFQSKIFKILFNNFNIFEHVFEQYFDIFGAQKRISVRGG